jgi:serine/threonine protein kinase
MQAEARSAPPVFFGHAPLKVGSYELHEVVSANRWGVIFAAQDQSSGAKRALGVLDPALVTIPGLRASFLQSANAARTRHAACLVRVFEAGVASELPYIVSEWMEGHDAHQLLRRLRSGEPLSLRHGLSLAVDAFRATALLHASGAQHGRIALDKLFLRSDGQFKLIGIGLPTVGHELWPLPDDPDHYALLAPEQITDGPVGPHTDVYALSLVAATLCSGSNPLQRSTIPQITSAILAGDSRMRGDIQRTCPQLMLLLGNGMARDPADRPDATDLADELDLLLEDEGGPVSADEWATLLKENFRAEGPVDRFREQALRDRSARVIQALQSSSAALASASWDPIEVDGNIADAPPLLEEDLNDPPTEETLIPALAMDDGPSPDPLQDPAPILTHEEARVPPPVSRGPTAGPATAVVPPPALAVEAPLAPRGGTPRAVRTSPEAHGRTVPAIAFLMSLVGGGGLALLLHQALGAAPVAAASSSTTVAVTARAPTNTVAAVTVPAASTAANAQPTKATPTVAVATAATPTGTPPTVATPAAATTKPAAAPTTAVPTKAAAATTKTEAPPAPTDAPTKTTAVDAPTKTAAVAAAPTSTVTPVKADAVLRYPAGPVLRSVSVDRGGETVIVTALLTNGSAQAFHYLDEGGATGATRYVVRLKGVNASPQRVTVGEPGVRSLTVSEDGVGAVLVVDCDCSSSRPVRVTQTETSVQVTIPKAL